MLANEIMTIKKHGKLIAICNVWQYWIYNGVMYSINVDGMNISFWCSIDRLNRHLYKLYQIHDRLYFTDDPNMVIIDKNFLSKFAYA